MTKPYVEQQAVAENARYYDDVDIPSATFVLDNGLTVIVYENHDAPVVSLNLIYKVGSKDEIAGKTGFAHLFEHLMFEGSENASGSFLENLLNAGATNLNAYTEMDRTTYHETVPVGSLDYALFMESDRMGHFYSTINQNSLDQQRRVVLNEKLETESGPYGKFFEKKMKGCFPAEHPYAHTVIGEAEDIHNATLEDVQHWFRTYYTPSNAVLALAGAIDVNTAREKVQYWFGHIPPGPPLSRPTLWIPTIPPGKRDRYEAKVPNGHLILSWNVPPYGDDDTCLLSIVANVLASGMSSRLIKRLVYNEKLASEASASISYAALVSQFVISVTALSGVLLDEIENSVREEVLALLENGVEEDELERVKAELLTALADSYKTSAPIAELLSSSFAMLGDADGYRRIVTVIRESTVESVKRAARTWLRRDRHTMSIVPFTAESSNQASVDRSMPPEILPPEPFQLPPFQYGKLKNGLPVILVERHSHPNVSIEVVLPKSVSPHSGLAMLAADLVNQSGAGGRDAFAFNNEVRRLGAAIGVRQNILSTVISLNCRTSRLSSALPLFWDRFQRSYIEEADFERQRTLIRDSLNMLHQDAKEMVSRLLPGVMYPQGHPYRRPLGIEGTSQGLEQITFDQVQQHQRYMLQAQGGHIFVVGDATLEQIIPQLNASFGSIVWPKYDESDNCGCLAHSESRGRVFLIDVPGAEQTSIVAATLIPGVEWSHEATFTILNNVFANGFTSRINLNLREAKNWTYGVHGSLIYDRGSRIHAVQTSVQADRSADAVQEMLNEYQILLNNSPVNDKELEEVKTSTLLGLQSAIEGLDELSHMASYVIRHKMPDNYWFLHQERIRNATVEDVNALARQVFSPESLTWVIAGDLSVITPSISALGLGEIEIIPNHGDALYSLPQD